MKLFITQTLFTLVTILTLTACRSLRPRPVENQTYCFFPKNNAPVGIKIHFQGKTFTGIYYAPESRDVFSGKLLKKNRNEWTYQTRLFNENKVLSFFPSKKQLYLSPPQGEDSIWDKFPCNELKKEFR